MTSETSENTIFADSLSVNLMSRRSVSLNQTFRVASSTETGWLMLGPGLH